MRPRVPPLLGGVQTTPPAATWASLIKSRTYEPSVMEAARLHMEKLGLPCTLGDGPIVLGGHQPGFPHAGIVIKLACMDVLAEQIGGTALNITVDTDLPPVLGPVLPEQGFVEFYRPPGALPFAMLPPPTSWERLPHHEHLQPAIERVQQLQLDSLGETLDALRRFTEPPTPRLEVPLSKVCRTESFKSFVRAVLHRRDEFRAAYNESLRIYRIRHKVRTRANPVPDLRTVDERSETPFWVLQADGTRRGLWTREDGTLLAREVEVGHIDTVDDLTIWPKALGLTLYLRRYVGDIFVHGVGGALYDGVTDGLFQRFCRTDPPPYVCATASLSPLPAEPPPDIRPIQRVLRDIRYNPQRFTPSEDHARLVAEIQSRRGRERIEPAARLRQLNEVLRARIRHIEAEKEAELAHALQRHERFKVDAARDYAWYLYPPDRFRRLAQEAFQESPSNRHTVGASLSRLKPA